MQDGQLIAALPLPLRGTWWDVAPVSAPPSAPSPRSTSPPASSSSRAVQQWSATAVLTHRGLTGLDGHVLTFALSHDGVAPRLLLRPGQYISVTDPATGESRPYTPIEVTARSVTLLVRAPKPAPEEPSRGAFARWLSALPLRASVRIAGPCGAVALDLCGAGSAQGAWLRDSTGAAIAVRRLALVAGGSGVTPVASILHAACARAEEEAAMAPSTGPPMLQVWVLLSFQSPDHALLATELGALCARHTRLVASVHVTYTRCVAPSPTTNAAGTCPSWRRVDAEMLRARLPPPAADTIVLVAGPPGFEASVDAGLASVGHERVVLLSASAKCASSVASFTVRADEGGEAHGHATQDVVDPRPSVSVTPRRLLASLSCCVAGGNARPPLHKLSVAVSASDEFFSA